MAGPPRLPLILASGSPRRRELLAQAGYEFAVEAPDVDESLRDGEAPGDYVRRLAEEKAQSVCERHRDPTLVTPPAKLAGTTLADEAGKNGAPEVFTGTNLVVLGADTTVVCDGEILAKPDDAEDAKRMLRMLSGRVHEVLTGVAVASRSGVVSAVETTKVTFSEIPENELERYCATAEPLDKAGAYGIQGYAARWIPRIDGDYFNVMGLPIARVVRLIDAAMSATPLRTKYGDSSPFGFASGSE
ncbi:MAG: Maf family protein [Acidobacteriota bacterium]|nr:Maf family protein [Acidobacteriota bacterium]